MLAQNVNLALLRERTCLHRHKHNEINHLLDVGRSHSLGCSTNKHCTSQHPKSPLVALLLQVWEMMASQLEQIVFTLMTRALAIGGKLNCPPPLPRVVFKKLFSELGWC